MGTTRASHVTQSLRSWMRAQGYELNQDATKINGRWWPPQTVFYSHVTGRPISINLATILMLEASLIEDEWEPIE